MKKRRKRKFICQVFFPWDWASSYDLELIFNLQVRSVRLKKDQKQDKMCREMSIPSEFSFTSLCQHQKLEISQLRTLRKPVYRFHVIPYALSCLR